MTTSLAGTAFVTAVFQHSMAGKGIDRCRQREATRGQQRTATLRHSVCYMRHTACVTPKTRQCYNKDAQHVLQQRRGSFTSAAGKGIDAQRVLHASHSVCHSGVPTRGTRLLRRLHLATSNLVKARQYCPVGRITGIPSNKSSDLFSTFAEFCSFRRTHPEH